MRRRELLASLGLGALIGGAGGYYANRWKTRRTRVEWKPAAFSEGPHATNRSAYFSEERLHSALGVTTLATPADCLVVAYNFPSWHPSPFMEKIFGPGWTEWETLKAARPLYPGHTMPKFPLWGYFNEADPAWAEREIDAAADHGIHAWMIDWYWHSGTMFYQEQLESGFLKARNSSRLKFALMWANHDWRNLYPAPEAGDAPMLLAQAHSEADCVRAIDYCIEHYFHQPNYWRIDGGLVFGIFDLSRLAKALGVDGMKSAFDAMRKRVSHAGLGELHIQSNNVHGHLENRFRELGINSATYYHTFGGLVGERASGGLIPYGDAAVASIEQWKKLAEKSNVPSFPDCPVGWDDSPRFGRSSHMVTERSPDQYERLLRAARHVVAGREKKVVYLSSWNEWTEDHFLLPDEVFGFSYLEAVKRSLTVP